MIGYMRTTQYTIEARPILMDFSQKITLPLRVSEDTEVVIVDTQPKEFKGETKYSEGIQYGVEIGVGAAGPVPTAAGKGNMTVSHVKERVYSD